jgi:hypothetical protein
MPIATSRHMHAHCNSHRLITSLSTCIVLETVPKRHVFVTIASFVKVNTVYCNTSSMHVVHGTTCVARFMAVTTMVLAHHRADCHLKNKRVSLTFPPAWSLRTANSHGKASVSPPTKKKQSRCFGPSATQKHCKPTPSDTYPPRPSKKYNQKFDQPVLQNRCFATWLLHHAHDPRFHGTISYTLHARITSQVS